MPTSRWNNKDMSILRAQVSTMFDVFQHFFNRGPTWWNHGCLGALVVATRNLDELLLLEFYGATPLLQAGP
jgi:hypothetical protein